MCWMKLPRSCSHRRKSSTLTVSILALAVAFLSAIGPAETAVRGSLVEALEYD